MSDSPAAALSVRDVISVLEGIAPIRYAESWDNVGLLLGSGDRPVTRVLLTIDLTEDVLDEAIAAGTDLLVAYHPPIFDPLTRVTDASEKQRIILRAAREDITIYSPHTALDSAPDGLNDWLVRGLGGGDVRALITRDELPETEECKLVTYCPREAVEQVRSALATVGAGIIGDYRLCSFEMPGTGTFMGLEGTTPAIGEPGRLERVPEIRLEMVIGRRALALAMRTLRQAHPYEEPPVEIHALEPRPMRNVGGGRRITLDQPATLAEIVDRTKATLGVKSVRVARGRNAPESHRVIGACAGAGGGLVDEAITQGCDVYLTGEMRHHDVMAAIARGLTLLLPGHTNTERGYLPHYRERILAGLDGRLDAGAIMLSERDRASFDVW
jgi:dinuclear metal center YbgI/SA1388 family protein